MIGLTGYLVVSAVLFAFGLVCLLTHRHMIHILLGIELIFNAAALNFVAFSHYVAPQGPLAHSGQIIALFIVALAATEAAVAMALTVSAYRVFQTIHVTELSEMKN